MGTSNIEWTEQTWNPIVGCSIVSPGCTNCYAMKMAARIEAMGNQPRYAGTTKKVKGNAVWTGLLAQAPESVLLAPLKRKKPTTYFVNSMGDLFHEDCPDEWIDRIFAVMALCPQHTFQVLTKRASRMRAWSMDIDAGDIDVRSRVEYAMCEIGGDYDARSIPDADWPLPNVWLGVSTERQQEADERIPLLLQTPAAVRFISAEPLLGSLDLNHLTREGINCAYIDSALDGFISNGYGGTHGPKLDWVIVGGESGKDARPMHPDWVRSLHHQCNAAGTKFFFKQWGEWGDYVDAINVSRNHALCGLMGRAPALENDWPKALQFLNSTKGIDGTGVVSRVGKKAAGRHLDGVLHDAMPQAEARGRA